MKFTSVLFLLCSALPQVFALPNTIEMMVGSVDRVDSPDKVDVTLIGDGYRRRNEDDTNKFEGANAEEANVLG
ncbi:MAG: hypothetical protein MMC23_009855 [Stictis urceolatum]|nr:hypothetical protein [Stictis urceolata]